MGAGSQAWCSGGWISVLFAPRLGTWLTFCCFTARWASSSLVGRVLLVSITSLPFYSLLLFGLACLVLEGRFSWGARRGDFGGGGGSLGWTDFPGPPLPSWFSINSIRLFWGFLWIPISYGRLLGDESWSNTSNSSTDSVKSTKPCSFCSSFPSSPSWRIGEGDDIPAERVATGSGWVNTVLLGSGMPSRTMNPL